MDGFLTLMEFSIALAGFTSIVVVFVHKDEDWNTFDKFRVQNGLMSSLGAAFLSAIPIGLSYLNFSDLEIWKTVGWLTSGYIFTIFFLIFYRIRNVLSIEDRTLLPKRYVKLFYLVGAVLMAIIILSELNVLKIPLRGLCYFAIIYLLLLSVFAFSRVIFYRPGK